LNFRLALIAAKDIMEKKMYTECKPAKNAAFKDTLKE
jgi:hypothetical protein